jgi:hypothetical protein
VFETDVDSVDGAMCDRASMFDETFLFRELWNWKEDVDEEECWKKAFFMISGDNEE